MTTTTDHRQAVLDGLRDLITYLTEHPQVPIDSYAEISYCVLIDDDAAGIAEVTATAQALGVAVSGNGGGYEPVGANTTHYHAVRRFGPVSYKAFYVTTRTMAVHRAHMSYSDVVVPEECAA